MTKNTKIVAGVACAGLALMWIGLFKLVVIGALAGGAAVGYKKLTKK